MEQKQKIIVGGVVGGLVLIGLIVGIILVVNAWKSGKINDLIDKVKIKIYGRAIKTIHVTKDNGGALEIVKLRILDASQTDISQKSTYKYSSSGSYLDQEENNVKWAMPNYVQGKSYISKSNGTQFATFTLEKPIYGAAYIYFEGNPTWPSRPIGNKIMVKDSLEEIILDTTITDLQANYTIPITK